MKALSASRDQQPSNDAANQLPNAATELFRSRVLPAGSLCASSEWAGSARQYRQPSAPPPVKLITKEDRARVAAAKDDKARLRITIEIAEAHLTEAETSSNGEDFDAAATSLGKYHALVEDALTFLGSRSRDENRTRDLYKRLELSLRGTRPSLSCNSSHHSARIRSVGQATGRVCPQRTNGSIELVLWHHRSKRPAIKS